jgi:hypothetical protein
MGRHSRGRTPVSHERWERLARGEKGGKGDKGDRGEPGGLSPSLRRAVASLFAVAVVLCALALWLAVS